VRKRKHLEPWQAKGRDSSFVAVSYDLLDSPVWPALNAKQKDLYLFACRRRYYTISQNANKRKEPGPAVSPIARWPDAPTIGPDCFYLNFALARAAGFYKASDRSSFYLDINYLVSIGLLDKIIPGGTSRKEKAVFRMGEHWKEIQEPPPQPRRKGRKGRT